MGKLLRKVFAWGLIAIAGLGVIGVVHPAPDSHIDSPGGALVMLTLMAVAGGLMLWRGRSVGQVAAPPLAQGLESSEHITLHLAKEKGGRVTAVEVAAATPLSLLEAEKELERIEKEGGCHSIVSQSGMLVYCFPEFEREAAKREAFFDDTTSAADEAHKRLAAMQQNKN